MQSELKPCPFCGGPAHSTPSIKHANLAAVIMCTENDCASVFGADLEIATQTWNRRSALVDVPAEPVAWLMRDNDDEKFRVEISEPDICWQKQPLYLHPPLSREGEDSAEVLRSALERISDLTPANANARNAHDLHITVKAIADAALAATRSGSATTSKGISE